MTQTEKSITLYHCMRAEHALRTLATRLVKVATFDSLNDPFELDPCIVVPDGTSSEDAEKFRQSWFKTIKSNYGMICMSSTCSDPATWAHYADKHSGIALEVDYTVDDTLVKVDYSDERVIVQAMDILGYGSPEFQKLTKQVMGRKYESWRYESEYRVFVPLDKCVASEGMYFTELPVNFITRVILGVRCQLEPAVLRGVIQRSELGDIPIAQAKKSETKFAVEVQDLAD